MRIWVAKFNYPWLINKFDGIRDVYVLLDRTRRRRDAEYALVEQFVTTERLDLNPVCVVQNPSDIKMPDKEYAITM